MSEIELLELIHTDLAYIICFLVFFCIGYLIKIHI